MPDGSLRSLAREARTALGLDPPEGPFRADLDYATDAELDGLCAALEPGHEDWDTVARLSALIEGRRLRGEPRDAERKAAERRVRAPSAEARPVTATKRYTRTWTPPVTPELVTATAEARAGGRSVLAVTDAVTVELGFLLHGEEPESNLVRSHTNGNDHLPFGEPEPKAEVEQARSTQAEKVAEAKPPAPPPAPRPLSMIERAHASGRQRRWHGDDEATTAAEILEREF
jgi:hypothetical protein